MLPATIISQFDIPGTAPPANVTIDLAGMSQLATGYNVSTSKRERQRAKPDPRSEDQRRRHRQRSLQEWRRKAALPYPAGGRAEPGPARGAARQRLHRRALSRATSRSASRKPASLARSSRRAGKARTWISPPSSTNISNHNAITTANSKDIPDRLRSAGRAGQSESGNVPAGHDGT